MEGVALYLDEGDLGYAGALRDDEGSIFLTVDDDGDNASVVGVYLALQHVGIEAVHVVGYLFVDTLSLLFAQLVAVCVILVHDKVIHILADAWHAFG